MTAAAPSGAPIDTRSFAPFEWMLAGRYLRARRKEGFISVIAGFSFLGIMLGVATLIIVMAVMNGFRKELVGKILGLNGHIIVNRTDGPFEDYEDIAKKIAAIKGVKHAIPLSDGQVMASSPAQAVGANVRGIAEAGLRALPQISDNVRQGTIDGFNESASVAIGIRLADNLRLKAGDTITLISPRGACTPFGCVPRTKGYPISAIFEMGMSEYDRIMVFMPLEESQKFFGKQGQVEAIEVLVEDANAVDAYTAEMKKQLGPNGFWYSDWRKRNEQFIRVLDLERTMMFIILSLIVLVAAFNIISGLMMLVKDKGRDIGILRTMGATKGAIMRVFLITGAAIGVVGTLAGLVLGVLFCWNIESIRRFVEWITGRGVFDEKFYYLSKLPAELDPWETGMIVLMALALSILATLYPSWRASRLDPVEALRYG